MARKKPTKPRSRRKPAADLDDSHALQRLFPKEVRDELRQQAKAANRKGAGKGAGKGASKRHGR